MIEIERKFLVRSDQFKTEAFRENRIVQGYLNTDPERTVRVRIKGEKAYITIKGKGNASGMSRMEWEKHISVEEAELLLPLCEPGVIDKIRYDIQKGDHIIEVDVFFGDNFGLVLAEIELKSETEQFQWPDWLGQEVTNDPRYYNAYLSKKPFKNW